MNNWKTKYRVMQVANDFYPQYKLWWFPFWMRFDSYTERTHFTSLDEAIQAIKDHINNKSPFVKIHNV